MFQAIQPMDASFLGGETIRLPIVAEIAAGLPCEALDAEPIGHLEIPRALLSFPPPYLVFRITGRSMEPHLLGGDIVVCSEDWQGVDTNGKIMAFRSRDGITIKRLVVDYERETTWLMPINQEFHPVPFTEDSAEIQMIGILDLTVRRHNRD
ncbi:MAG: S24 family peptidase [Candidatus Cloacimonadaceae bacterium]